MIKVIVYGIKCWFVLLCFLSDGCLEIDNNIVECVLCGVVVGCCNWLFVGLCVGGECGVVIYIVIQICKVNGVDLQVYIIDVIVRVVDDWFVSWWDELMLWNWFFEFVRLVV